MDAQARAIAISSLESLVCRSRGSIESKIDEVLAEVENATASELGEIIMTALRVLEQEIAASDRALIDLAVEIEKTPEIFALVLDSHDALISLGDDLVQRVKFETGALASKGQKQAEITTKLRWSYAKKDLQNKVQRQKVVFEESIAAPQNRPGAPIAKNSGGKPLAEHWDAMWAAIAVQLWLGDLKPSKQADIKAAMLDWFNANEIEIGDTAVTERARKLWREMEATEG